LWGKRFIGRVRGLYALVDQDEFDVLVGELFGHLELNAAVWVDVGSEF
jgi:hypothetical protein